MKKIVATAICLLFSIVSFSQEKGDLFARIKEKFVVHDTVYIFINPIDTLQNDSIEMTSDEEMGIISEEEIPESIPLPIDTIDTDDKFQKIVLFDDGTWGYYNLDKPVLPDSIDIDHWETEQIHSYRDIATKDLPEEVTLPLIDSIHGYCIPHPGKVISTFKWRKRRPHKGVDITLNTGDAVYSAFDGVVRIAMPTRMSGGYGNVLVIRHANGLETYYGHLSKYLVESGDIVKAGELIGYGGSTGRSTGPHLHFETRYMGQAFDPERIFDFEKGAIRDSVFVWKRHYININSHYGQSDKESKATSDAVYHKVQKGDTLSKIANKYGTTVKALCKLNGIKETKLLQIGQRLRVR